MKKILKIKSIVLVVFVFFNLNTFGQNNYIGKLGGQHVPPEYTLETGYHSYLLTINSFSISLGHPLIFDGIEYFFGDTVSITGYLNPKWPGSDYFELEIETIEKWSLNPNVQHFLGTYLLKCKCIKAITSDSLFYECSASIKESEDAESDLLTDIESFRKYKDLKTFTYNNAFFIPRQENEDRFSFIGGGETKNDSLFLNFEANFSNLVDCDCKGKKTGSENIISPSKSENKIYYDAITQLFIFDETLQNQSLTLKLYNIQGQVILKAETGRSVSIAHLPNGVYLYRLLENGRVNYSGKILKNN